MRHAAETDFILFRMNQGVEKVALPLFRGGFMNVFLRKIAFFYGKRPAPPAKPADTILVLQTAE